MTDICSCLKTKILELFMRQCFREDLPCRNVKGEWIDMVALGNIIIALEAIKLLNVDSITDYSKVCWMDH